MEASQLDPTQIRAMVQNKDGTYMALMRNGAKIRGIPHKEGETLVKVLGKIERETYGPRESER